MFIRMLVISSMLVVSGCSVLNKGERFKVDQTRVINSVETVEVKPVQLNLPIPRKPELINDLKLYECVKDTQKYVCSDIEQFKNHLKDLTEVYRYQLELESTLRSYQNFYEPKQ